jgi:hypothetical protein
MFNFLKKFISYGRINGYSVKLVDELIFNVPADYIHSKQIESFQKYADREHISYMNELSDKNLEYTSYQLEPGEQYYVKVLRVGKDSSHYSYSDPTRISSISYTNDQLIKISDCVEFLERQNSMYTNSHFVGAQGLTYIWQFIGKQNLEAKHPIISMDTIENIDKNGNRLVTISLERWGEKPRVRLASANNGNWYPGIYLLHVIKITEVTKRHFNESNIRKHN